MPDASLAPVRPTANAAFSTIDALQRHDLGVQEMGMACAFLLLCEARGYDPRHLMGMATNLMNHDDGTTMRPEFRAVGQYVKEELI